MSNLGNKNVRPWDIFNKNILKLESNISQQRLEICRGCEEFMKLTSQCKKCGCFMNSKVKLPSAECPLGKWSAVTVDYKEEI
jgi:hypothetical protein